MRVLSFSCRADELTAGWPVVTAAALVDAPAGTRVWMPAWRSIPTLTEVRVQDARGGPRVVFVDDRDVLWSLPATAALRAQRPGIAAPTWGAR